jgi:hypothetical protein
MSEIELKALAAKLKSNALAYEMLGEKQLPALLREAAAALAPQWQPIESAPKAKTPMVVVIGVWGSYVTDPYAVFWNGTGWARWPHKAAPTHWLRLPAPPEVVG